MKRARVSARLAGALLVVLVGACSFLGLAPAQSFDERLAYAYGTHTAVLQATASAKASGALSGDDVQHVVLAADQARALLDAARAVETSDPKGAATKLQTAARILTELQTWLHGRGVT